MDNPKGDISPPSPILTASWWSRLTFSWLNTLIRVGGQRPLDIHDLYEVEPALDVHNTAQDFEAAWQAELHRAHKGSRKPSLVRAFTRLFGLRCLGVLVQQCFWAAALVVQPLLMRRILRFVADADHRE